MTRFGDRVRAARRRAGMSQAQLAGDHMSVSYVSHLEAGRREPTPQIIDYFEKRLGVQPGYLRGEGWGAVDVATEPVALAHLADLVARSVAAASARDFERALDLATTATHAALDLGRSEAWWQMGLLRIDALIDLGRYADAIPIAQDLADHPWVQAAPALAWQAHLNLSKCLHLAGRTEEGAPHAITALDLARSLPANPDALVRALVNAISSLPEHPAQFEAELIDALRPPRPDAETKQAPDQHPSREVEGIGAWTLGNLALARADIEEGLVWHERADAALSTGHDLRNWARFARASLATRLAHGVDDGVKNLLTRARAALELVPNPAETAELARTEAKWRRAHGDADGARDALTHALTTPGLTPLATGRLHLDLAKYATDPTTRSTTALLAARNLTLAGATSEAIAAWRLTDIQPEAAEATAVDSTY